MKFSETDYDFQITSFEFQIMECDEVEELKDKLIEIKKFIKECKLLHFRWKLEDDYEMLKNKINEKIKELEDVTHEDFV